MPVRRWIGELILLTLTFLIGSQAMADERGEDLPAWFDGNRVQAHFENGINDDLGGLYKELHPVIKEMGANVLTRIFKTTAEGAWWKTGAGYTHESLNGRDLGRELAEHAHQHGLAVFAYYRIMCDDFVEQQHPEWLCRDVEGKLVLEPRTRRRPRAEDRKHVICFNSPARELVQTRLLELADRGVDGIYFDSWHMPEVCTCQNCRTLYREETGGAMPVSAARDSADYRRMTNFVARSLVRNFGQWKQAVTGTHPDVMFAIGSSLYPCFDRQMQITAELLDISDTSKTEFAKPFGGSLGWPIVDGHLTHPNKRRPYLDDTYALPKYDLQNALGWSLTRDSCNGRPPLMWVPFTRTEQEALFSAAAAVSYGCVASLHPTGVWKRRSPSLQHEAIEKYRSAYAIGSRVSPHLATARPYRSVLLHVSEQSRDLRIADEKTLWCEFFAPLLGAFEVCKEQHLPSATINDLQLSRGVPAETDVLILGHGDELTDGQKAAVTEFVARGGKVLKLDSKAAWYLRRDKPELEQRFAKRLAAAVGKPEIRVNGPARMHAVYHRKPSATIVCLMNSFGWYHSTRNPTADAETALKPPAPCSGVTIEISPQFGRVQRAREVLTNTPLTIEQRAGRLTVAVPEFPIMGCVLLE